VILTADEAALHRRRPRCNRGILTAKYAKYAKKNELMSYFPFRVFGVFRGLKVRFFNPGSLWIVPLQGMATGQGIQRGVLNR
jgi:hypothetical protein